MRSTLPSSLRKGDTLDAEALRTPIRSVMTILKRMVARLPERWQSELKRMHFRRQILRGRFTTSEPEFGILPELIRAGDWAIDIGANIGHYTKRLSELVGANGRIIAIEPVPSTFALLSANVQHFQYQNVTLINAAASDKVGLAGMSIPKFPSGLLNNYEAAITNAPDSTVSVLTVSLDMLSSIHPIALIKIDAEGHEKLVLEGIRSLIRAWHPVLIVETSRDEIVESLGAVGYTSRRLPGSPNVLFLPSRS